MIGVDYTREQISGALRLIGADLDERPEGWIVTAPTWRPDLTDKWTLAEEVARIEGYDRSRRCCRCRRRVAGSRRRSRDAGASRTRSPRRDSSRRRRSPFTTEEQNDLHGSASGGHLPSVKLANPLDGQAPFLRRSLIPGLLEIAHRNVSRGFTDLALFEVGIVFLPEPGRRRTARRSSRRWRCDRMPRPSPRWTPRSRRSTAMSRCC